MSPSLSSRPDRSWNTVWSQFGGCLGESCARRTALPKCGRDTPLSPFDRIAVKQLNANTFVDERKKRDGLFHAKVKTLISEDGKTLTTVATGTNSEGKPFTNTLVHERQ